MKTLVKLDLVSKNNIKNGFYLYVPIILINGVYYRCESIKSKSKIKEVKLDSLVEKSIITPEYYKANGICQ